MGQQPGQMFGGVEGGHTNHTPAPTNTPTPTRGAAPMPFRGRGMPPQMPARGRAPYAPRSRGTHCAVYASLRHIALTYGH